MPYHRVTKYDPRFRDPRGRYARDEWTSAGDVGRCFGGVVLTGEEYRRVEDAYVAVALSFLRESGVSSLTVTGLESTRAGPHPFSEGSVLDLERLAEVIRGLLREEFWCRLEGPGSFIHVGWDYYMYLGVPCPCPTSEGLAARPGLFVEEFRSPYLDHAVGGVE
jgi:hypothetical protein